MQYCTVLHCMLHSVLFCTKAHVPEGQQSGRGSGATNPRASKVHVFLVAYHLWALDCTFASKNSENSRNLENSCHVIVTCCKSLATDFESQWSRKIVIDHEFVHYIAQVARLHTDEHCFNVAASLELRENFTCGTFLSNLRRFALRFTYASAILRLSAATRVHLPTTEVLTRDCPFKHSHSAAAMASHGCSHALLSSSVLARCTWCTGGTRHLISL